MAPETTEITAQEAHKTFKQDVDAWFKYVNDHPELEYPHTQSIGEWMEDFLCFLSLQGEELT